MGLLKRRYAPQREQGFTLIELLVVILIIGVLAAIAVPLFVNQRKTAADSSLKSDVRNMALAMETWQVSTGKLAGEMTNSEEERTHGWSIVVHGSPDARFLGDGGQVDFVPDGFTPPKISEGNAVGVFTNPSGQPGRAKNYCILGSTKGGSHDRPPSGPGYWASALYYDPVAGGLFTSKDLPAGGACNPYHVLIQAGK